MIRAINERAFHWISQNRHLVATSDSEDDKVMHMSTQLVEARKSQDGPKVFENLVEYFKTALGGERRAAAMIGNELGREYMMTLRSVPMAYVRQLYVRTSMRERILGTYGGVSGLFGFVPFCLRPA